MEAHRLAPCGRLTLLLTGLAILATVPTTACVGVNGQGPLPTITVEFDAVADRAAKTTDDSLVVEGFRIGYFRPDSTIPIRTVEVPRTAVSVNGGIMRLAAPRLTIEGSGVVVLRVQSLSKGRGASAWSNPTGPVTLPTVPAVAAAGPTAPTRERRSQPERRQPSVLSGKDLDAHPALKVEFTSRLGSGRSVDDALKAFRRVQDVATAVTLSRLQEIPLDDLCRLMVGPPAASLRQAIRRLKPSLTGDAIRAARADGRRLLSPSRRDQRP